MILWPLPHALCLYTASIKIKHASCSTFPYCDFCIPGKPLCYTLPLGFLVRGRFLTWWICHRFTIVLPAQLLVTLNSITINSLITCQAKASLVKIIPQSTHQLVIRNDSWHPATPLRAVPSRSACHTPCLTSSHSLHCQFHTEISMIPGKSESRNQGSQFLQPLFM